MTGGVCGDRAGGGLRVRKSRSVLATPPLPPARRGQLFMDVSCYVFPRCLVVGLCCRWRSDGSTAGKEPSAVIGAEIISNGSIFETRLRAIDILC